MITDIRFECTSCGQKMLVDAQAAGMHADCPSCGCHVPIPKVRAMNDREYAPKASRKREASRNVAAVVGNGSPRHEEVANDTFSDPEMTDLRQELLPGRLIRS